jgi:5-methylcytosine-specific restriction enzyme A
LPSRPPIHRPPGWTPPDQRKAEHDRRRPNSAARLYDHRWRNYRTAYLAQHPLCVACAADGQTTAASVIDHIVDHNGDHALFWDPANHQPLCAPCHNRKTGRTAAFGRKPQQGLGGSNP